MTSSLGSAALLEHPLIAFDAWHRLGDHYSLRSPSAGRAEPAYAAALAAFSNLDDGCCDGYHDIGAKLDHRTFVSYWADVALISNANVGEASSRRAASKSMSALQTTTSSAEGEAVYSSHHAEGTRSSTTELTVSEPPGDSGTVRSSITSPSTSSSDAVVSVKGGDRKPKVPSREPSPELSGSVGPKVPSRKPFPEPSGSVDPKVLTREPSPEPSGSVEKQWASYVPGAVFFHRCCVMAHHNEAMIIMEF
jgi:hypothetical protein